MPKNKKLRTKRKPSDELTLENSPLLKKPKIDPLPGSPLLDSNPEQKWQLKPMQLDGKKPQDYDKYFTSGVYQKRYLGKTNSNDAANLLKMARRTILNKINKEPKGNEYTINIVDYACGDGRYIGVINRIAQEAQAIGKKYGKAISISYIGSDPSKGGIENFRKKKDLEFGQYKTIKTRTRAADRVDPIKFCTSTTSPEHNLTISLLSNSFETSLYRTEVALQELLGIGNKADILTCMYGSLSHIANDEKVLEMFRRNIIDDGEFSMTVPNINTKFLKEQRLVRRMDPDEKKKKGISKEGDITYERHLYDKKGNLEIIENWYHLYDIEEIADKVRRAGFYLAGDRAHISHVKAEGELVRNALDNKVNSQIAAGMIDLSESKEADFLGGTNNLGRLGTLKKKPMPKPNLDENGNLVYKYEKRVLQQDKLGVSPQEVKDYSQYFLIAASTTPYESHVKKPPSKIKPLLKKMARLSKDDDSPILGA